MDGKTVVIVLIVLLAAGMLFTGKLPVAPVKGIKGSVELSFVYSASGGNVSDVSDVSVSPDINPGEAWFKHGFSASFKIDSGDEVTDNVNVTVVLKVDNESRILHSTSLGDKTIMFEAWGLESGEHSVSLDIYVQVTRGNETVVSKEFTRSYTVTVP